MNYLEINKRLWNKRTEVHVKSNFYDNPGFIKGRNSLNDIELNLLGNVEGKSVLHLQCHFGQDTISLNRMGAEATGVDLSDEAIRRAKKLAAETQRNVDFICCDVYSLKEFCDKKFDIVFSSYGTIGWLPDLDAWAGIISHFLKPGGKFVFVEFHPVVWMFDNDFKEVAYTYSKSESILETEQSTYGDPNAEIMLDSISWNHGLAEVFTALRKSGLVMDSFSEFDYSPYNCFNKTEEFEPGKFRIKHLGNKIPMVYSILAVKPE